MYLLDWMTSDTEGVQGQNLASICSTPFPGRVSRACLGIAIWAAKICVVPHGRCPHGLKLPPLVTIALGHYQLEAIHPFLDGNGRGGRLRITWCRVDCQSRPAPLLWLFAFCVAC